MQDVNGYSSLNSPIKTYIRIENEDKMEIAKNKITMRVALYLNDLNVGTSIGDINTAISTIQGNISTINTDVSNLKSNKQNNITLIGGTNITVTEDPRDTFTIESSAGSNLL